MLTYGGLIIRNKPIYEQEPAVVWVTEARRVVLMVTTRSCFPTVGAARQMVNVYDDAETPVG